MYPVDVPLRCIAATSRPGDLVLDPFSGAGITGVAARQLDRRYVGIDLNPDCNDHAIPRLAQTSGTAVLSDIHKGGPETRSIHRSAPGTDELSRLRETLQ